LSVWECSHCLVVLHDYGVCSSCIMTCFLLTPPLWARAGMMRICFVVDIVPCLKSLLQAILTPSKRLRLVDAYLDNGLH
jgi:hypothetical protein